MMKVPAAMPPAPGASIKGSSGARYYPPREIAMGADGFAAYTRRAEPDPGHGSETAQDDRAPAAGSTSRADTVESAGQPGAASSEPAGQRASEHQAPPAAQAGRDNGSSEMVPERVPFKAGTTPTGRAGATGPGTWGEAQAGPRSDSDIHPGPRDFARTGGARRGSDGLVAGEMPPNRSLGERAAARSAAPAALSLLENMSTVGARVGAQAGSGDTLLETRRKGLPLPANAAAARAGGVEGIPAPAMLAAHLHPGSKAPRHPIEQSGAGSGARATAPSAPEIEIASRSARPRTGQALPLSMAQAAASGAGLAASGASTPKQPALATRMASASVIEAAPQSTVPPLRESVLHAGGDNSFQVQRSDSRGGTDGGEVAARLALGAENAAPMRNAISVGTTSASELVRAAGGRDILDQIVPALQRASGGRVELMLSPAELGRVEIALQNRDGAMSVSLSAERPETLELLRRHIDLLADDMRRLGFSDLSFSFADGSARGSHGDGAGAGGNGADMNASPVGRGTDTDQPHAPPTAARTGPGTTAHLDIRL